MRSRRRFPLILVAFVGLAGCNFPTPSAAPITEAPAATEAEPTIAPSAAAVSPEATAPATSSAPIVSPTPEVRNLRVVYTDDGNLWGLEIGSSPRQLTDSGGISEVRISGDGEWIAYTIRDPEEDTAELHGIEFDGSNPQVLKDAAGFDALYPLEAFLHYTLSDFDFIRGTHTLLINTRGVFEGPGLAKNDDLLAVDVETGRISPLLAPGAGGDFTASPTGDSIAVVRPDSIGFVNADGSDLRAEVLTFRPVITYSEYFFYPIPVWSGEAIVFPVPQEDPFFAEDSGTVWNINDVPQAIAQPDGDLFAPQRQLPIISPDGSSVVYFRDADAAGERELVIHHLESGVQIVYDSGSVQWKGWSPNSTRFVYSRGSGLDLYLGELGTAPVPLGSGTGLRWVNSNEYLFLAGVRGSWTLTLADLAGGVTPLAIPSGDFVVYDFAE